jgi:hypothetical protein
MSEDETTTIQVDATTRNRLAALGDKDSTFNSIIVKLLDYYTKVKKP